jgi:hypothetical protein
LPTLAATFPVAQQPGVRSRHLYEAIGCNAPRNLEPGNSRIPHIRFMRFI